MPFPMHAGTWTLTVCLTRGTWRSVTNFVVRILLPDGTPLHTLELGAASIDGPKATWLFEQPYLLFALSIDIGVEATADEIAIDLPLSLCSAQDDREAVATSVVASEPPV
jgi:hypothetical protein